MSELKVALITGGTKGLGKELLSCFAEFNYQVVGTYSKDHSAAEQLMSQFKDKNVLIKKCDVTSLEGVEELFKQISKKFGRLDVVINNAAATFEPTAFSKLHWHEFQTQVDVSLKGSFNVLKQASEIMRKKKDGVVLNILTNALKSTPPKGFTAYAAGKAALLSLAKSFDSEFSRFNIRTYNVFPGLMDTALTQSWHELMIDQIKSASLSKDFVSKRKVAELCLELSNSKEKLPMDHFIEE